MLRVTWTIDLDENLTFPEAALKALDIMQDPDSCALVFEVTDLETGVSATVDLWQEEDES